MAKYDPLKIEKKWQKYWAKGHVFDAADKSEKPKKYILVEFPYPSGAGLHAGHLRGYIAGDTTARYYRAKGFEVMFPIGWDAFGLPAENFAIKMGVQPQVSTEQNIKNFKRQIDALGLSFDWSREISTIDPEYYKWTQWIFLQFYKAGLAYESVAQINWCPKDKTGLSNEEVIDGKCERCGTVVEKRDMRQWFLKITAYAQKLLDGLKDLDWPEAVKTQQANWIGKSIGAEITFKVESENAEGKVTIFTTRPDTLFGATYVVLAPEHPFLAKLRPGIKNLPEVEKYISSAKNKSDLQRSGLAKEKHGIQLQGVWAVHPATGAKLPLYIADYVLVSYGTGAIMAVPAHDPRDFEFASKYNLPIVQVIDNDSLISSQEFDGLSTEQARLRITAKYGKPTVQYKLRDWVFSRQRYWGEPIPLIHCEKCGIVAVPEKDLPVLLPKVKKYEPTGTGESPLAGIESWVNVKCPICDGNAKRETNTMPQWAGSSWYYLRYCDPHNKTEFASMQKMSRWLPVDMYFGGMEHTTLHLLYSRFWNLFLHDQKLVPVAEPYIRRIPHGIVLGPDGEKMSKSRGNVINPDELIARYGTDTLRMFEMFLGPHDQVVAWNDKGMIGVRRFLERAWQLVHEHAGRAAGAAGKQHDSENTELEINKLLQKISTCIETQRFNTAVSAFMEFVNNIKETEISNATLAKFVVALAPFAPHIAEELWAALGHKTSVNLEPWPEFDSNKLKSSHVTIVVQVNGKLRANLILPAGTAQADVEKQAKAQPTVVAAIAKSEIRKTIFVPDKIINFVVN